MPNKQEILSCRSELLDALRQFFLERHFGEVETPLLSADIVVDAHLHPFTTSGSDGGLRYLQTSPEAGMKRLLATGCGSIFQITRSFRRDERGPRHNPEFTMVEWYGVDTNWQQQMKLTEQLVRSVTAAVERGPAPDRWNREFGIVPYDGAFRRAVGTGVLDLADAELIDLAARVGISHSETATIQRDDLLNLILAESVEGLLGQDRPEFVCDYPVSQAALAEQNPADPRTACRFELYDRGLELCNGYQELTDPGELARRDILQNTVRRQQGTSSLPGAPRMAAAMKSGLPPCSGVALGFDRLLMAITESPTIDHVIPFPTERA